jgi:hypothetical protein
LQAVAAGQSASVAHWSYVHWQATPVAPSERDSQRPLIPAVQSLSTLQLPSTAWGQVTAARGVHAAGSLAMWLVGVVTPVECAPLGLPLPQHTASTLAVTATANR